jgi:hypothetical protein
LALVLGEIKAENEGISEEELAAKRKEVILRISKEIH